MKEDEENIEKSIENYLTTDEMTINLVAQAKEVKTNIVLGRWSREEINGKGAKW